MPGPLRQLPYLTEHTDITGMTEIRTEDDFSDEEFGSEDDVTPDDVVEPRDSGVAAMTLEQLSQLTES